MTTHVKSVVPFISNIQKMNTKLFTNIKIHERIPFVPA